MFRLFLAVQPTSCQAVQLTHMLTKGAVEDLIMQHLSEQGPAASALKKVPEVKKKVFLSDWELRRIYKPGAKTVQVHDNVIISPLSLDWLDYNGVAVVRGPGQYKSGTSGDKTT